MAEWHDDPDLAGRFHEQEPDDLQVVVHEGEPRRTQCAAEACWVRVTGVHGTLRWPVASPDDAPPIDPASLTYVERPVYAGRLLNQPHGLPHTNEGDTLLFVASPGLPHPLRVDARYLAERPAWSYLPCSACGADQSLDAPSTMARTRFPNAPQGSLPLMFSAFCPCGGTMVLTLVDAAPPAPEVDKPWWRFW